MCTALLPLGVNPITVNKYIIYQKHILCLTEDLCVFNIVTYVFVSLGSVTICRLYKLTLSHQAQVTLQLTVSLSDLV